MTITADPPVIAFPKIDEGSTDLAIPDAPVTAPNEQLATVAKRVETRKTLSCKALLVGSTLEQAKNEAADLYEKIKVNPQVQMLYGRSAVEDVNSLIDRILHEVEPTKIPELTDNMRGLQKEMRGIKHKYDVSDPDVQKRYEGMRFKVGRWFGRGRTMLEMLMEDIRSIESNLEKVEETLQGKQNQMMRNVSWYDQLYAENESEIGKLIYAIAVMELVRDLAAEEAASIEVGDASLGDRGAEKKANIAQHAADMEVKIAEYKGRLFVAWATSPQCRMMRTLNVGLAQKLNEMICVVIPTMKATIAEWRLMQQSKDAADMSSAVADFANETLQDYARAAAVAVPAIAEAIQTPTLTPVTVSAMADSILAQAEGIIAAAETGAKLRAELDASMIEAQGVLESAATTVSDAVVNRIVGSAERNLEIAQSVAS